MAGTRKFDYNAVSNVYSEIKKIITGSDDSIKTILDNINRDCHNMVDVEEEAVYGDLGKQLLLDWDNTSSNFPNFVNNFDNWSALIAQASGNYSAFEDKIAGFNRGNPLGATSGGIETAYVNASPYRLYKEANFDEYNYSLANMNNLYTITGVEYVCTDTASLLKTQKIVNTILFSGDMLALLTIGAAHIAPATTSTELTVYSGGGSAGTGTTELLTTGATPSSGAGVGAEAVATAAEGGTSGATFTIGGNTYTDFAQVKAAVENNVLDWRGARSAIKHLYDCSEFSEGQTYLAALSNYFKKGIWIMGV